MEAILLDAGYSVGVYSSPHLIRYNERVRINGVDIVECFTVLCIYNVDAINAYTLVVTNQVLLQQAREELAAQQALGDQLKATFDENDKQLNKQPNDCLKPLSSNLIISFR